MSKSSTNGSLALPVSHCQERIRLKVTLTRLMSRHLWRRTRHARTQNLLNDVPREQSPRTCFMNGGPTRFALGKV